ncbi:hypothetical protein F1728_24395 [Gimesia benthica]|uniref:Uncharacterized protein n=1 Tax=Gimesia benthica TaxID=2608982 RepID=A0A6I6AMG0_9PLAN|nr:hypothetical protein [Gimesia benthica]QGQ25629.1 hypothetical protein F1728_24395 [Gimesia benthica]
MSNNSWLKLYWMHGLCRSVQFRAVAIVLCLTQIVLGQDAPKSTPSSENENQKVSNWIESTKKWITSTKRNSGNPPTDRQLSERAVEAGASPDEFMACWKILLKEQQPVVSKSDLIELIKAKRASIHDMYCKYKFQWEELDENDELSETFRVENSFFRSGVKLRMHAKNWKGSSPKPTDSDISYNGDYVQYVDFSLKTPNASISKLRGYNDFYFPYDVLANAMLLNSDVDLGLKGARPYDLLEMLGGKYTLLLQRLEEVDGRECLVATDTMFRVYLDVERDFSVIRFESVSLVLDSSVVAKIIDYQLDYTRRFESMKNYGNGLWLPHKIETTSLKDGKVINRQITEVSEMTVNEGVNDNIFNDIIPKGAFVFDSIQNASYRYGENQSIEGTLEDEMKNAVKRGQTQWALIIINIVFVCAMIGWMLWRRHSQDA